MSTINSTREATEVQEAYPSEDQNSECWPYRNEVDRFYQCNSGSIDYVRELLRNSSEIEVRNKTWTIDNMSHGKRSHDKYLGRVLCADGIEMLTKSPGPWTGPLLVSLEDFADWLGMDIEPIQELANQDCFGGVLRRRNHSYVLAEAADKLALAVGKLFEFGFNPNKAPLDLDASWLRKGESAWLWWPR
jgi:hypothetical protein